MPLKTPTFWVICKDTFSKLWEIIFSLSLHCFTPYLPLGTLNSDKYIQSRSETILPYPPFTESLQLTFLLFFLLISLPPPSFFSVNLPPLFTLLFTSSASYNNSKQSTLLRWVYKRGKKSNKSSNEINSDNYISFLSLLSHSLFLPLLI